MAPRFACFMPTFLICTLFLAWAAIIPNIAARENEEAGRLMGTVVDGYYIPPTDAFRVKIPIEPGEDSIIMDDGIFVSFQDNKGTAVGISAYPMTAYQKWEYESRGIRDYVIFFFGNYYFADFKALFPESTIETALFLPNLQSGSLLTYTLHPGGSQFDNPGHNGRPAAVAKRGNLCFVRDGFIYIISIEHAERILKRFSYFKTPDEENDELRERILAILRTMEFPTDLASAAP